MHFYFLPSNDYKDMYDVLEIHARELLPKNILAEEILIYDAYTS
jgi:hypothetical protein